MSQVTTIGSTIETSLSMSSKEIASLTGKEHKHVVRDIRAMLGEIGDGPDLDHVQIIKDSRGYTSQIRLNRDLTQTLVTGYSVPLRLAVIRRLNELEAQISKPAPVNLSDAASLRGLLIGYTEQVIKLEHKITEDKPKVEFYDEFVESAELQTVSQVAKLLGTGPILLFRYLQKHKILIGGKGDNKNMPIQKYLNSGRMDVKYNNYTVPETGEVKIRPKPLFTRKGVDWIREFVKENGRVGL